MKHLTLGIGIILLITLVLPAMAGPGVLFAGGSNPGYVYRYAGGTTWNVISPGLGYAVLDIVEYDGHLYAGTMSTNNPQSGVGKVYRYDGGTTWTLVGDNMDDQVASLAVYEGDLYAGTGWNGMKLYKYGGGTTWTQVIPNVVFGGTRALYVSHGLLLMGDHGWDRFGHWDGTTFTADLSNTYGSCIYDYADYNGKVYAAAFIGRMWQSPDATTWSELLGAYDGNLWELETFRNELYMSYGNGELRKSSIPDRGTVVYAAPDGIISMTTDWDNLYFGTGGEAGGLYGSELTGIAEVYQYDGTTTTRISDADEMVTGVQVLYVAPTIEVPFDVKPQSCRNPLNVNDKGVLPAAILGTSSFDVTWVDISTVRLEGVAPSGSALEDVATPFIPYIGKEEASDCTDMGPDGYVDLTLKFDNQAVVAALGTVTDGEIRVLHLTGNLLPAYGGNPITGEDVVVILRKK